MFFRWAKNIKADQRISKYLPCRRQSFFLTHFLSSRSKFDMAVNMEEFLVKRYYKDPGTSIGSINHGYWLSYVYFIILWGASIPTNTFGDPSTGVLSSASICHGSSLSTGKSSHAHPSNYYSPFCSFPASI